MELDNKGLVELIEKMKEEKTQELQNKVVSEVLKSRFLCPVVIPDAPHGNGKIQITKDTKIQFSIIKTTDDKNFLIAFTSDEEVHKWQKEQTQQSIIYTFEDYAKIVVGNDHLDGFIIDPHGVNLVFTQNLIEQIKSSVVRQETIAANTQIEVSRFSTYPEGLVLKLQDMLINNPIVKKGYLLLMKQDNLNSALVILDCPEDNKFFGDIATGLIPFLSGISISIIPMSSDLGQKISEKFEPIYVAIEDKEQ